MRGVPESSGATSPLRWLIGSELEHFRSVSGLPVHEASTRTGIGAPKINHMEKGRQLQEPRDIRALLDAYGTPAEQVERLVALTGRAADASWWTPWAAVVPTWVKTFAGLEGLARSEFAFEPTVIPGLFQTQDYAAAIVAGSPRVRMDHGERFVGFRMARVERVMHGDRPVPLHAVIAESALRLAVGSQKTRQAQLRHLIEIARLPNVTIQVVRPEDGLHTATAGPFVLLEFDAARPVCYVELKDSAVYLQEADQIATYTLVAANLKEVALDPEKSFSLIESMLEA